MLKYSLFGCVNAFPYPRLRFDCVGAVYAFANAVYIFANIGANAEMLVFCFCDNLALNAVTNLA